MVKNHYPELFKNDRRMREKAEAVAERTYELTQFLVHVLKIHEAGLQGKGSITYHSSCQLTRELGVREEPVLLLESLRGAKFIQLPHADRCCGFGGIFMAKLPEVSMALADEKADAILSTGAEKVTGCDHGCLMNIADALNRRGSSVKVEHIAAVLAEGLK
jgi:L-lactate dehydrogenase complex protein LldE